VSSAEWTLEIAKLLVVASIPLIVFFLGTRVTRATQRLEEAQWANRKTVEEAQWSNRKLIEHRLVLYDRMAPKLNDLFVFFARRGHFKSVTPNKALESKRELDQTFYAYEHLFSTGFAQRYHAFIDACFEPFTDVGHDAKFRTDIAPQKRERTETSEWDSQWDTMFSSPADRTPLATIRARYAELMERFAAEVGVRADERKSSAPAMNADG